MLTFRLALILNLTIECMADHLFVRLNYDTVRVLLATTH